MMHLIYLKRRVIDLTIKIWDEVETLENLADEARAQLKTIEDLDELEEWLESETITEWLHEELRLVLKSIIRTHENSLFTKNVVLLEKESE